MRYVTINNFSVATISEASEESTTLVLSGYTGIADALAAHPGAVLPLTAVTSRGAGEVLYVTGIEEDVATVLRGQEGTPADVLPEGATLEARTTAGLLNRVADQGAAALVVDDQGNVTHRHVSDAASTPSGSWAVAVGELSNATTDGVAVGRESAAADQAVALGRGSQSSGYAAVALGPFSHAADTNSTALGRGAYAAHSATSVGPFAGARASKSVVINTQTDVYGEGAVVVGHGGVAGSSTSPADSAVAVGIHAQVSPGAHGGLALGPAAVCAVPSGLRLTGIPYIAKDADDLGPQGFVVGATQATQAAAARRVAASAVFATDPLDMTTAGSVTLALPPGLVMAIDSIDAMVVSADAPAGTPTIQVGTAASPTKYLAPTAVTATAVGNRDTYSPASTDGAAQITATVGDTATGTLSVRIVVRGYVMEI